MTLEASSRIFTPELNGLQLSNPTHSGVDLNSTASWGLHYLEREGGKLKEGHSGA